MEVTTEDIKKLRERTGAGILDCKKALEAAGGNAEDAVKSLREKGAALADKKGERTAAEGVIGEYLHFNSKVGVLVEINCETDFVAKNESFTDFAHSVAMHITAYNPRWIQPEDIPEEILEEEKEIYRKQLEKENKPDNIIDKIIDGKLKKFYEETCLLNQPYAEDDSISVEQALQDLIHATGENIKISRFVRFQVGEEES